MRKPTKPEVIPFVVPNAGTPITPTSWSSGHCQAVNPKHGYEINGGGGSADNGYARDATEGQLMRSAPATNLLKKGLTYQIKLRGEDGANGPNGPWSDHTSVQGKPATVANSNVTSNGATLTVSNLPAQWWYKGEQSGAQCTAVANGTTTASLTGLDSGTEYTYNIYYRSSCTEDSAKAAHWDVETSFTTLALKTLTASNVTHNTATLTLSGYTGNWWLQIQAHDTVGHLLQVQRHDGDREPLEPGLGHQLHVQGVQRTAAAQRKFTSERHRRLPHQAWRGKQRAGQPW